MSPLLMWTLLLLALALHALTLRWGFGRRERIAAEAVRRVLDTLIAAEAKRVLDAIPPGGPPVTRPTFVVEPLHGSRLERLIWQMEGWLGRPLSPEERDAVPGHMRESDERVERIRRGW